MPLLLQENVRANTMLWVWKVEEGESFFMNQLSLSSHELSRLNSYTHAPRRLEWLASRLLVKLGLGENGQVKYTDDGKPLLVGVDGHISISHSHTLVGLLFSTKNSVGLDIERVSSRPAKITRRFMQEQEVALLENDIRGAAITRAWCSKEALFKVLGKNCYTFKEDFVLAEKLFANSTSTTFFVRPFNGNQLVSFLDVEDYCIAYSVMHS